MIRVKILVVIIITCLANELMRSNQVFADKSPRPVANPAPAPNTLEFSVLIISRDVTRYLSTEWDCRKAAKRLLDIGTRRVFLESYRGGHRADLNALRLARDVFREEGLIASGAVTTTWGQGFGKASTGGTMLCYSAPETQQALADNARQTCRLFDEVIYDDFLFTDCRCERCTREKGDRSWAEYRMELKSRVARDFIVHPGHQANPNVVIIIKYPQWYDKFHQLGFDVIKDTANFDAIWVGTETRGPDTKEYGYVPVYQSAVVYRWLKSIGGQKTRGGWFDYADCTPDEFVDQAYSTVLAGSTSEVTRWNGFAMFPEGKYGPLMVEFAKHRPHVEALARMVRERTPLGIYAYKPPHSEAGDEAFWLDYFGNLGIPLIAVAEFPDAKQGPTLVLTRSARCDPKIDKKVIDWADQGKSLIVSTGFLAGASRDVQALFGIDQAESKPMEAEALLIDQERIASPDPMPLGGGLEPGAAEVRVAGRVGDDRVAVFTVAKTPVGGFAAVLNLRTHDLGEVMLMEKHVPWIDLPEPVANMIREVALTGTGLQLTAPARVVVYPFSNRLIALINARDTPTPIGLKLSAPWFPGSVRRLAIYPGGKEVISSPEGILEITLPPRARWAFLEPDKSTPL